MTELFSKGAMEIAWAMKRILYSVLISGVLGAGTTAWGADPAFTRTEDVIYGRKQGVALTMDVFTPRVPNGAAVIWAVSGGWFSNHDAIQPRFVNEFLTRGYTVFAVVHGSQPKFTIPEIIADMNRSVRYIRANAKKFNIDADRFGITGASAGGHLSLMQGTAGDLGNPKASDPIDRVSSRVQAVACFFPPTDFLNFGIKGYELNSKSAKPQFRASFDYREFNEETRLFERVKDEEKIRAIGKQISPITHVSADDPPTLIIHGDADALVPIQQARVIVARFQEVGVPVELVVKKGAGHGWATILDDTKTIADWFDKYLKKNDPGKTNGER
jgi:acetyl esterase/lipase